jgi:hypothetical protein
LTWLRVLLTETAPQNPRNAKHLTPRGAITSLRLVLPAPEPAKVLCDVISQDFSLCMQRPTRFVSAYTRP